MTPERLIELQQALGLSDNKMAQALGVHDLHFHDLRHEGISRLFEMGCNIPQVACVSGHRSWQSLKRYTHIRQRGDKYAGWKRNPGTGPGQRVGPMTPFQGENNFTGARPRSACGCR